jgi:hypothetical protein
LASTKTQPGATIYPAISGVPTDTPVGTLGVALVRVDTGAVVLPRSTATVLSLGGGSYRAELVVPTLADGVEIRALWSDDEGTTALDSRSYLVTTQPDPEGPDPDKLSPRGRLRELIADTGAQPKFSDEQLDRILLENRTDLVEYALDGVAERLESGQTVRRRWELELVPLGSDYALEDGTGALLQADTADEVNGVFVFASDQPNGVYATGTSYDVYGAAADALEQWAASLARDYDFATGDGKRFDRSQAAQGLLAQAAAYRRRQRPSYAAGTRAD